MDYAAAYERLISRARRRPIAIRYLERHHVLPRCMGGGDHPDNIVHLTPEEHYVAHQLLVKMHPRNHKLLYAVKAMTIQARTHGSGRANNKLYGWIRRRFSAMKKMEGRRRRSGRKYNSKQLAHLAKMLRPATAEGS